MPAPAAPSRNGNTSGAPIFLLALLVGVGTHLAGLALLHFNLATPNALTPPPPFVHFVKAVDEEQEKLMLEQEKVWDPRLVFTPTSRNYASRPITAAAQPQPRVFKGDAGNALPNPKDSFNQLATSGIRPVAPSDALKPAQWDFLSGIGQAANASPLPAQHGPQLRVTPQSPGTDATVTEITWDAAQMPKTSNGRWQPASFLLVFNQIGLASPPLLERSSGVPEVDADLSAKLRQWYARHRLPAGYYSVEVGP